MTMSLSLTMSLSFFARRGLIKVLCMFVMTSNLLAAVCVIFGLLYEYQRMHNLDCWVTEYSTANNQYIASPDDAAKKMSFGDQAYEPSIYFSSCSIEACCDIVLLPGLRANIGVLIWPENRSPLYFTNRRDMHKIAPDRSLAKLPGVVYVWPLDEVSLNVIKKNPDLAIQFYRREK